MNSRIKNFYVAIKDNEVIAFDTNLKAFVTKLLGKVPENKKYIWFYREFEKGNKWTYESEKGLLNLQQLI